MERKKSVIYGGTRSNEKVRACDEIEMNDASVKPNPVRLSISSNERSYFTRVRGLSVFRYAAQPRLGC